MKKKRLRVLALIREGLKPPDSVEGLSEEDLQAASWRTEHDVVAALKGLGHEVRILEVYSDLGVIRQAIEEWKPDVAFNLLEEFSGVALYDQNVVTYLELMGVPYTGCNPRGLVVARDKALSKKLLAYHRLHVPAFAVFPVGRRVRRPKRLGFPLIVKSALEDASLGIAQASLVKDDEGLAERVRFVHERTGAPAIAEEFIEGRELYVGVLGNDRIEVLPVWELVFRNKPEDAPLIATARAKWNVEYQKKWGVDSGPAKDLPEGLAESLARLSKRIYRLLGLSGYARLDFRLSAEERLYFLEANPNPQLANGEDFADSAEEKGIQYNRLIRKILNLGLAWRPVRGA